jgi:hypothetical protein
MRIEAMEDRKTKVSEVTPHKIVSKAEWLVARKDLLKREKELTHLRDEISRHRRELPWVKVEKEYVFDAPEGKVTLTELFDGRSQLFIKHFMMGPGAAHQCVGCSLEVDHVEGLLEHLHNHDVTYAASPVRPSKRSKLFVSGWAGGFPGFRHTTTISIMTSTSLSDPRRSLQAARSTIFNRHRNGRLGSKTFRATASSTRTSQRRSSIPTRLMVGAASNFSAFTDISTSCRKVEMRTGHITR